jgi:PTH1 family peptidyl-tRNA hydrolase
LCSIIADDADLLAKRQDASFQNKVHLGMQAKGFFTPKETPSSAGQTSD